VWAVLIVEQSSHSSAHGTSGGFAARYIHTGVLDTLPLKGVARYTLATSIAKPGIAQRSNLDAADSERGEVSTLMSGESVFTSRRITTGVKACRLRAVRGQSAT
jgi:hypothetical protein